MKQFTKHLRWLLASLMLVAGMSSAWAADETITFSSLYSSNTVLDGTAINGTNFSITFQKRDGGTATQYYTNGSAVRWYGGGTLTIASSTKTIEKIEITFTQTANTITTNVGAYESGTWTGSASSVVFTQSGTKGQCRISAIAVTYKSGGTSDPSISADNVNIAYDATGGTIAYTVNNPVTGGTVSASTTADWITLGSATSSPVSFTCSTNTAAAERTATVTLAYTYGSDKALKDVTITQAGNPNVVNNISDITANGTYTVKGTIVAKSQKGFIVGDGTGYVYYYNSSYDQNAYNIGDKVKLSGSVVTYGGVFEFDNSTTIETATESNYVEENPTVLSGSDMDSRVSSTTSAQLSSFVQYEGKLSISDTHYNITDIAGATTAKGSISYPLTTDFTSLDGQTVKVTGYFVGVSSSTYYNTMLGSIEAVAGFVAAPEFDVPEGEYDAAQEVTITCATTGASIYYTLDGTDPTTSSTLYDGTALTISTTTTLKAIASDGTNLSEITSATYTIDTRTPTTMYFAQDRNTIVDPGTEFTITVGETVPAIEGYVKIGDYEAYLPFTTPLSYRGDNSELATVDATTGAVTLISGATGTLKVTATFEGDTERKGCEGYYTLKVNSAEVTDVITATFTGVESTSYTAWSNKTGASGAVYAGKTARDSSGNVQLRSKESDCGIVTTTSPGKATMVTVEWGSGNTNDRKLDIYGSNTAYESAADLYDSSKQGTQLGSIVYGTSTQLAIEGDYAYIGIRSNSGALYCNKITIYWETTTDTRTATTVTLNPSDASYEVTLGDDFTAPTATLDHATAGTLTYESSDETVATVNASTGAVEILAAGTTTITAKFAGNDEYKPSQASYTITVTAPATTYTTIQQLQGATTSTSTDITFQMTDIYVTAVKNNQAWISDGTYGALIYTAGHGLTAGKKLNGTITGKLVLYNGATEITNFDGSALTTTDEALAVQTKTIGQIELANQSLPVKFEGVTYDATAKTFSDGTNTIAYYDQFSVSPTLEDGHVYNIAGLVIYYKKLQIAPLKAEDVVDVTPAVAVEAPVFSVAEGNYTEDQTVTITCATTGTDIFYTLDGSDPTDESTPYSAPIVISETTTLKAIAYDGDNNTSAITTATYTINKPDVPNAKAYGTEYYTKVTDLSQQIEDGDAVIIVNEAYNVALSTTQNNNNRSEVAFEWMPWIGGSFVQLEGNFTVEKFIIDKDGDNFYFYASRGTKHGYIYAASSSSNHLKTTDTKSNNAKAVITIENGDATITFQGTNTRNLLRYNASDGLFACYGSGQQPVQLYVERPAYVSEADQEVTVADAQDCYKTFITPYDARFDGVNDHAYIVTLSADQKEAILKEVSVVPAGTPIIYKYETAGKHPITRATSGSVEDVSDNVLKVSRGEVKGDGTVFVLNKVNDTLGFYPLKSGNTLAAGKCYLSIDRNAGAKFIGFNFDDVATGIETVESTMDKVQGTIYDLQGRRVTTPAHGLYIVNGKKVFIK